MKYLFHVTWLAAIVMLHACTSAKSIYYSASAADYNARTSVDRPALKHKLNPFGLTLSIGATAAGAYLGYKSDLISLYDPETKSTKSLTAANAVLGGLVGYGVASLGNYLIGKQGAVASLKSNNDLNRWLRKHDRNAILLEGTYSSTRLQFIDKRREQNYIVKNWQDILDFKTAFGNQSLAGNAVVQQGINKLNREDLPKLLEKFPNTSHAEALKKEYMERSSNVAQAIEAGNRYPDLRTQSEVKAFSRISNVDDAAIFMKGFPSSSYKTQVDDRVSTTIKSIEDARVFMQTFPKSKNINAVEKQAIAKVYSISDARLYQSVFPNKVYENDLVEKLGSSLHRDDLPDLVKLFPSNPKIKSVKQRYIRSSGSIFDLYFASLEFEGALSQQEVESLARPLIKTLKDADDYLSYFAGGRQASYATNFIQESLLQDLNYLDKKNLPELSKLVYKYAALRHAPADVYQLENVLNDAEKPFQEAFSKMVDKDNLKNYDQLLYVIYETQPDVRAFTVLDKAREIAKSIDIRNPWIDYIYSMGANGSVGIIYGHYCCADVGSELFDIPSFKSKVGGLLLQNPYIIKHQLGYNGSATIDALKNWWNSGFSSSSSSSSGSGSRNDAQRSNNMPCYDPSSIQHQIRFNKPCYEDGQPIYELKCSNGKTKAYYKTATGYYYQSIPMAPDAQLPDRLEKALKKLCDCEN